MYVLKIFSTVYIFGFAPLPVQQDFVSDYSGKLERIRTFGDEYFARSSDLVFFFCGPELDEFECWNVFVIAFIS
jgi:hypothetical protein